MALNQAQFRYPLSLAAAILAVATSRISVGLSESWTGPSAESRRGMTPTCYSSTCEA
jgi:hypothetical protein